MKKILCFIVVVVFASALFIGCASKDNEKSAETTSGNEQKTEEVKKDPVTLHIIHWNQLGSNVIDKFESENAGIKIQFEQFPVDRFIQVIKTRIAASEIPDILGAQEIDFKNYISQGVYMDITEENFLENYYENAVEELKEFSEDGRVYSVPTNAFSLGIWLNKDILNQNDLPVPTNYQELVQVGRKLKENGIPPFVQGIMDGWPLDQGMYTMFDVQVKNEGIYEKTKTGEAKWTDDVIMKGFKEWADFFGEKDIFIDGSMGLTYEQAYQTFEQGKAAMWPMGSWATEFMADNDGNPKQLPFEMDFIPIFSTDSNGQKVIPGTYIGAMYAISADTKNANECKTFFEFLTKPENATEYAKGNGVIFPVKGIDLANVIPYGDKVSKTTLETNLVAPFNMTVDAAVGQQVTVALQSIVSGRSVEDEVNEIQKVQEKANQERK